MMKQEEKKKDLLTVAQAAKKLGYSWPTIYRWIREEDAPYTISYAGLRPHMIINLSEFTAWLKAWQTNQPPARARKIT